MPRFASIDVMSPISGANDVIVTFFQGVLNQTWNFALEHEPIASHPLFDATLGLAIYFLLTGPLVILELVRPDWYVKYKVQPSVRVTGGDVKKCLLNLVRNQVIFIFPLSALRYFETAEPFPLEPPMLGTVLMNLVKCTLLFDVLFFLSHYALHFRWLYKKVHYLHHEYHSTNALVTQYLHPIELLLVGGLGAGLPFLFQCHRMTHWIWMFIVMVTSVEHHSGLELPFDLHWLTFGVYAGGRWHDMHHQRPLTNYCAMLCVIDKLLGTDAETVAIEKAKRTQLREMNQ